MELADPFLVARSQRDCSSFDATMVFKEARRNRQTKEEEALDGAL